MWTRLAILGSLVAGYASGQDASARQRLIGAVRGAPESAEVVVTLVSRPFASLEPASGFDRIEVKTDARGRFGAKLLPGRSYSAWAATVPTASGEYRASTIVESVVAGSPLRLVLAGSPRSTTQLLFAQGEAWDAWSRQRALRARVVIPCANPDFRALTIRADSTSLVPPVAGTRGIVEVRAAGGVIFQREFALGDRARNGAVEVALRPPRLVVLKVAKEVDGTPVAGATVWQRVMTGGPAVGESWSIIGTSDTAGIAVCRTPGNLALATPTAREHLYCRVEKEGFADARFGRSFELIPVDDADGLRSAKRAPYTVKVAKGCRLTGRILLRPGTPARRTLICLVAARAAGKSLPSSLNGAPRFLATDDEGRFSIDRLGPRFLYRLSVFLSHAQLAALGAERGARLSSVVPVAAGSGVESGEDVALGDLDLSTWRKRGVVVRTHDGSPAPFARILAAEKDLRSYGRPVFVYAAVEMRADRLGRLRVLLPAKTSYTIAAGYAGGLGNGSLDAAAQDGTTGGRALEITLSKPLSIRGRVVGVKRQPVPGAMITVAPVSVVGRGDVSQLYRKLTNASLRSDAEGHFSGWAPFEFSTYYVYARVRVGSTWFSTTGRNMVEIEDEPVAGLELETNVPLAAPRGRK